MSVICPTCGKTLNANNKYAGKICKCKKCGSKMKLPVKKEPNYHLIGAFGLIVFGIVFIMSVKVANAPIVEEPKKEQHKQVVIENEKPTTYKTLRSWKPSNISSGLGLDILVEKTITKDQTINLIKSLSKNKDPVIIRIWTSTKAYNDENCNTKEFKSDYLAFYAKNKNNKTPVFRNTDEICWMQETGCFSHLYGKKTQIQCVTTKRSIQSNARKSYSTENNDFNLVRAFVGLIILTIPFVLYFLPSIVAGRRNHSNSSAIVIVNLFLGWTFLGWVVALAWSYTDNIKVPA